LEYARERGSPNELRLNSSRLAPFAWRSFGVAVVALVAACRTAGPYGYSRVYTPTREEAAAVAGKPELDRRGIPGAPDNRRGTFWAFGVVTQRSVGPGGAAYVALSLRTLQTHNQCASRDEDTCRVTVSDRETGRAHALVALAAEDDLGERGVGLGSLLRVVGFLAEDIDPSDGSAILRASFYRHWPRGFYATAKTTAGR
jgi:hypothetical protein